MASTNKTPNYDLPQWVAADKPTFLGDMNAAFLDIDTAMHENAESSGSQEQRLTAVEAKATENATNIANVSQVANTAGETATAAQNAASAASALATTANQKADTINTMLNLTKTGSINSESNFEIVDCTYNAITPWLYYAVNDDGSYGKIYGYLGLSNVNNPKGRFTIRIKPGIIPIKLPSSPFSIGGCAIAWRTTTSSSPQSVKRIFDCTATVGTNGQISLTPNAVADTEGNIEIFMVAVPIYFKNFGDQPTPTSSEFAQMRAMIDGMI